MKRKLSAFLVFLTISTLLVGCNLPSRSVEDESEGRALTLAALTVEAHTTQNLGASTLPPLAPSSTPPLLATNTPLPSNTPIPTNTLVPPTATADIPCNRANFVDDITIPDGAEITPGDSFTKTWRLKNTGSCTWNSSYDMVFDSGDAMGAPAAVDFPSGTVAPNEEVNVSIEFTAPNTPGDYRSEWKLRSDTSQIFGLGSSGTGTFFVEITVIAPLSYSISVDNSHTCGTDTVIALRVENTGTEFLQSSTGMITNLDTSVSKSLVPQDDPFVEDADSCAAGYVSDADPGETYYFLVNVGAAVSGDRFQITTTFCTENGVGGDCMDKTKNYEIP